MKQVFGMRPEKELEKVRPLIVWKNRIERTGKRYGKTMAEMKGDEQR